MRGKDYLQKQRQTYWVRMTVPPDVQAIIGKKVLKVTTGHRDYRDARAVAIPIARRWQQQIEAARRGKPCLPLINHRGGERFRSAALAVTRAGYLLPEDPPDWATGVLRARTSPPGRPCPAHR